MKKILLTICALSLSASNIQAAEQSNCHKKLVIGGVVLSSAALFCWYANKARVEKKAVQKQLKELLLDLENNTADSSSDKNIQQAPLKPLNPEEQTFGRLSETSCNSSSTEGEREEVRTEDQELEKKVEPADRETAAILAQEESTE